MVSVQHRKQTGIGGTLDKLNMMQCIPMTPIESEPGEHGGVWIGPNKEESQYLRENVKKRQ